MDYPVSDPTVGLVGGKFTDGNPAGGVPASRDPASWANLVTDELLKIITQAGLVPDDATSTQVYDALVLLGLRPASTALAGVMQLADSATVLAGVDNTKVPTPASLLGGLLGAGGSSAADYLTIPYRDKTTGERKNLIIQWGKPTVTGTLAITFPITFPNALLGVNHSLNSSSTRYDYSQVNGAAPTTSGFQLTISKVDTGAASTAPLPIFWLAFGY